MDFIKQFLHSLLWLKRHFFGQLVVEEIIIKSAKKTGAVVSAEEHNFLGGLGESISRTLSLNYPVPQEFIATNDTFGESGTPSELIKNVNARTAYFGTDFKFN